MNVVGFVHCPNGFYGVVFVWVLVVSNGFFFMLKICQNQDLGVQNM